MPLFYYCHGQITGRLNWLVQKSLSRNYAAFSTEFPFFDAEVIGFWA